MKRRYLVGAVGVLVVAGAAAWFEPGARLRGWVAGEPFYHGRPARYWGGKLRDADPVALSAALAEMRDGADDLFPVLARLVRQGPDDAPEVRWRAAALIGEFGDRAEGTVPALLGSLDDPDPAVRAVAVRALGKVAATDPVVIARLTERLDGPMAIEVLAAFTHAGPAAEPARDRIVTVLHKADSTACRVLAAEVLGGMGLSDQSVLEPLRKALRQPSPAVRRRVAEILGRLGVPDCDLLSTLTDVAVRDEEPSVREAAARALGRMGPAAALSAVALRRLLEVEKQPAVRQAAEGALRRIEGRSPK